MSDLIQKWDDMVAAWIQWKTEPSEVSRVELEVAVAIFEETFRCAQGVDHGA